MKHRLSVENQEFALVKQNHGLLGFQDDEQNAALADLGCADVRVRHPEALFRGEL